MKEKEISLLDLLLYVVKSWRSILICALIMAIAVSGLQYIRELKNIKAVIVEDVPTLTAEERLEKEKATLAELREEATTEEKMAVDKVIRLEKDYEQKVEYIQSSILMSMDSSNVYQARLQYWVNTDYKIDYSGITGKDVTRDIIEAYINVVADEEWRENALKAIGVNIELSYFGELISPDAGTAGDDRSSFFVVIKFNNQEQLEAIVKVLEEELMNSTAQIADIIGEHELNLVNESMKATVDSSVYDAQQKKNDAILSLENNIANYKNAFSDLQKSIYASEHLISEKNFNEVEYQEEEPEDVLTTPSISFSYILVGAMLGAFLIFMIRGAQYIFSNTLKPEDIRQNWLGIRTLGYLEQQQKSSVKLFGKIDALIEQLSNRGYGELSEEEQIQIIVADIVLRCNKDNFKKIYFNSTVNCVEKKADKIIQELFAREITVSSGGSTLQDPFALESMNQADAVVFFEQINNSRYGKMERAIQLCEEQEKSILGMVVLG